MSRNSELPQLLTVEEAAALLRAGRTKAYAMAKQWRATQGRAGLPVLDFGSVLRVPLWRLEAMVGGDLHAPSPPALGLEAGAGGAAECSVPESRPAGDVPSATDPVRRRQPSRRRAKVDDRQLTLLHPDDAINVIEVADTERPSTGSN